MNVLHLTIKYYGNKMDILGFFMISKKYFHEKYRNYLHYLTVMDFYCWVLSSEKNMPFRFFSGLEWFEEMFYGLF